MGHTVEERLKIAEKSYQTGENCVEALFRAYKDELFLAGGESQDACQAFVNRFSAGIGTDDLCCLISAASEILARNMDGRKIDGQNAAGQKITGKNTAGRNAAGRNAAVQTNASVQTAEAEIKQRISRRFRREYGCVNCRELLHGNSPGNTCCEMKIKDMILIMDMESV